MGIEENLNVGGVTKVWNTTDAGATNQGALQVVGGIGVAKTVFAADVSSGSVTVTDNTTSTTKDTGGYNSSRHNYNRLPKGCWWYKYTNKCTRLQCIHTRWSYYK